MIQKLPQEVINQIAAGEVVERPSSVVKELVDNAIDAQASRIDIKLKGGGKKNIEVSDNGVGIAREDLKKVFQPHTTGKIRDIEDLNNALTMGFRGEALSTIVSVSEVSIKSKDEKSETAYEVYGTGIDISEQKKTSRDLGTTVVVKNLFYNIPAREKYLRTDNTEYRKILDILIPYFLIYPNIQFSLFNDEKKKYFLAQIPQSNSGEISPKRIRDVLQKDFTENMLSVFYDGEGMKISGLVSTPEYVYDKTKNQYFFLNNRPVYDGGVIKAVNEAFSGFIPGGKRPPFILHLEIKPSLVDVNVHPRKEEIRFVNPFRVYSAIEEAVRQSLRNFSKENVKVSTPHFEGDSSKMRDRPKRGKKEVKYEKKTYNDVNSGLKFSEHLLRPNVVQQETSKLFKEREEDISCFQLFNKYILVHYEIEVWFVDQHAASERVNYEKIQKDVEVQDLLVPEEISLSESERAFLEDNLSLLDKFGFKIDLKKKNLKIRAIPSILFGVDLNSFLKESLSSEDLKGDLSEIENNLAQLIACHGSIRSGQKLSEFEMKELVKDLKKCKSSFSCPHGRPIIWKMGVKDFDKKFYR